MKNPITEQIVSHLEFLGYRVEDTSETEEKDLLWATHEVKAKVMINITKGNTVLIIARFIVSDSTKTITQEFLTKINHVNSQAVFTKWYYEETDDKKVLITIETFTTDYNKHIFGSIIEQFNYEILKYLKEVQAPIQ